MMKQSPTLENPQERADLPKTGRLNRLMSSRTLRFLLTVLCLWFISCAINVPQLLKVMQHARWDLIAIGWLATVLVMLCALVEWGCLVRSIAKISWVTLARIFIRMLVPSQLLPAGVAGEAVRIFEIAKFIGTAKSTATALVARVASSLGLSCYALLGATQIHGPMAPMAMLVGTLYFVSMLAIWSLAYLPETIVSQFVSWLRKFNKKYLNMLVPFVEAIHEIGKNRGAVLISLVASLVGWGINFLVLQLFGYSVGAVAPGYLFALALPLSLVASFAPFVLGGVGIREGVLIASLTKAGISAEQAAAIAILVDIQMVPFMGLSALFWLFPGSPTAKDVSEKTTSK